MDDVTSFMMSEGIKPVPESFLGSDFLLGMRIDMPSFSLVYRQVGNRLILCELCNSNNDGKAMQAFLCLVRKIIVSVPSVHYVDAMILPAHHDTELNLIRHRLSEIMLAEGAQPVSLEGCEWLRYSCRAEG